MQLDSAIHRREAAEVQASDFLERVKACCVPLVLRHCPKHLPSPVTILQVVEEEKLELEAVLNQQRREDRCVFRT